MPSAFVGARAARRGGAPLLVLALAAATALLWPAGASGYVPAYVPPKAKLGDSTGFIPTPRVVGGTNAPTNRLKHQANLALCPADEDGCYICGGSFIRPDAVLTAQHCTELVNLPAEAIVLAGSMVPWWVSTDGATWLDGAKISNYLMFDGSPYDDVAIIFTQSCAPATAAVPIALATEAEFEAAKSSKWLFSGWGTTSTNAGDDGMDGSLASYLQYGVGRYLDTATCSAAYGNPTWWQSDFVCAGGIASVDGGSVPFQDTCQGDSGGPLMFNTASPEDPLAGAAAADRLVGITSFGDGCGQAGLPGVYANVPFHSNWINYQLDANKPPAACAPSPSMTLTFVQVSANTNWFQPDLVIANDIKLKPSYTAARCEELCRTHRNGCVAYSVSIKEGKLWCSMVPAVVPGRLCAPGDSAGICGRGSQGAYRAKWCTDRAGSPQGAIIFAGSMVPWWVDTAGATQLDGAKISSHLTYTVNGGPYDDVAIIFTQSCAPAAAAVPIALATEAGQGGKLASYLQHGVGRCVNSVTCSAAYGNPTWWQNGFVCAGGIASVDGGTVPIQDACQGDSGGPLMFNTAIPEDPLAGGAAADRLVGVTSWGTGCGQAAYPGVYATVPFYSNWIKYQLDANKPLAACAPSPSMTLTFVQVSANTNWFQPDLAFANGIKLKPRDTAARCEELCRTNRNGCVAYSVSIKEGKLWCSMVLAVVPGRLCVPGDDASAPLPAPICARGSQGAYRAKWV
ncbi:MAG: trypsin-like cysteine/serine peptidase domain-containing protein [Monoraphidium minutum]|nr:MAG: trypsin-like cysteine/serine peptidase domain-containing protein [Monoraphidium minutum]